LINLRGFRNPEGFCQFFLVLVLEKKNSREYSAFGKAGKQKSL
jgi:hypothetical protein